MKRLFLVAVIFLLCTTGCGKEENNTSSANDSGTLTCTKVENNEDGYNVEDTMSVTYKDNIVTKVEETTIEEMDSDMIDLTVSFGTLFANTLNEVDGLEVSYSKASDTSVKYTIAVDYTNIDLEALKTAFGDDFDEDSFYADSNVTLDKFKTENLDGYTCN